MQVSNAMERMAAELQGDIQQYRREHDALVQQRAAYERRVLELGTELRDLERTFDGSVSDASVMDLGCVCGTDYVYLNQRQRQRRQMTAQRQLEALQEKQRRQSEHCAAMRGQNASLKWLLLMCERHPPERPALVQELEEKIAVRAS